MHGDFSRGHRPDGKRGQAYLRGLAQQRRLMLDSDINAMTDALHERLRALARHLGCPKGSPDLGYLVTPGRLLALFRELEGVVIASNNLTIFRDYANKYLDRYPSLRLNADQGVAGSATLRLRAQANGDTVFWCRAEAATAVTLPGGAVLNVPLSPTLQPVTVAIAPAVQDLTVALDPGEAIWIGLIEERQNATLTPLFDFASGTFYLNGLPLVNPADATWSSNLLPPVANFQVDNPARNLAANDRLLVYLEGWERHVSAIEDGGLLENALGGDTDTTTRGRAVGQVKLAWVPAAFDLDAFARALDNPVPSTGTLNVTTPLAPPNPDPCALPAQSGYTGRDHRFYRFEVHAGGALGTATIKWSRDNGAELFAVRNATDQALTFPANTLLQPGDLVEVLTADTIELGDASPAVLDGAATTFAPSVKAVGRLARLQAGTTSANGVTFTLREPDGIAPVTLAAHFGGFPSTTLKVRRWHGLIATTAAPVPNAVAVENGITIDLNGAFAPGDYWQYEARAQNLENANPPFQTAPHGPERSFSPLALVQFQAQNQPLLLERWLDDRFPPLCELTADDIEFDGDKIGSGSDTVQEIIEELWEKVGGGCCDFTLDPPQGDAAAEIRAILLATQGEVKICLESGVYTFTSMLDIGNRKVTIKGCPRAVLVANGVDPMIRVLAGGSLQLEDLVVFGRRADGARVLVSVAADADAFEARGAGFFIRPDPAAPGTTLAVQVGGQEPAAIDPAVPVPVTGTQVPFEGPSVRFDRCIAAASWAVSAASISGFQINRSHFSCSTGGVWAESIVDAVVSDSDLLAGMSLDTMQPWTAAQLLTGADALVAGLSSISNMTEPAAASAVLRIRRLSAASIRDSRMVGGVGLASTETSLVELHANFHVGRSVCVHFVEANRTSLSGDRFATFNGASAAMQLLVEGGLSITDCQVQGFTRGIVLGGNAAGQASRNFTDVQVQNNQIENVAVGVQLGTADANAYAGDLRHVAICENVIQASAVGILVNARVGAVLAPATPLEPAGVRVADNFVTARAGIAVYGEKVEVSDNRVHLIVGTGRRFGIIAQNTAGLICDSNLIDLKTSPGLPEFGTQLGSEAVAAAGVVGPYIAPSSTVLSAAIMVTSGSGARVSGNTAHTEGPTTLRSLSADNHARLAVKDNEWLAGVVTCTDTDDVVFLSNTVRGDVTIGGSASGLVCDNRVRLWEEAKLNGNLTVSGATGTWKLADNRADGALVVAPPLTPIGGGGFDFGDLVAVPGRFRDRSIGPLVAIDNLAADARFSSEVYVAEAGGPAAAAQPVPAVAAAADAAGAGVVPGNVAYAIANPGWVNEYGSAIDDFVVGGVRPELAEVLLDPDIIVILPYYREQAYQAMCTANWARQMYVGNNFGVVFTNAQSTIQVIGNRADQNLTVLRYARLVMALNVADTYPIAGTTTAAAIDQPNLVI